jgi:hypothetical protein
VDEPELAPVRLARVPLAQLGRERRQPRPVGLDRGEQLVGRMLGDRERPPERLDVGDVAVEYGAPVQCERPGRDAVVDARVAVPVAADPGAEAERTVGWPGLAGRVVPPQRVLEVAHELRQDVEEYVLERVQPAAHLVDHGRTLLAHLVGQPEQRDALAHAVEQPTALLRRQPRVVVPGDQRLHRPQVVLESAAACLGRVGGEDRPDAQLADEPGRLAGREAGPAHGRDRGRDRLRPRRRRGLPLALPYRPQPVVLLGQVDQVEVDREGAHQAEQLAQAEPVDPLAQGALGLSVVPVAQRDRGLADLLDDLEERPTALLAHDVAEQPAEQPNVVPQVIDRLTRRHREISVRPNGGGMVPGPRTHLVYGDDPGAATERIDPSSPIDPCGHGSCALKKPLWLARLNPG